MIDEISIESNLNTIKGRIKAACERSGRNPSEVTIVAVSKTKPFSDILEARKAGAKEFGENYVQEMMDKIEEAENIADMSTVRWHMIGHLQKNKVKYLIGHTTLIHSVDSISLAEQIEKEAAKKNVIMRVLLEVNVAEEESKWGFCTESVKEAARTILEFPHVKVLGLMTSAPYTEDSETNRRFFRDLNTLAHELFKEKLIVDHDTDFKLPVLSMGMTGDYEVAVEEGATMVRVGTAIFGNRNYNVWDI